MADTDGQLEGLVEDFYRSMIDDPWWRARATSRAALALRDAVKNLRIRGKGVFLERWVNFVHYGA